MKKKIKHIVREHDVLLWITLKMQDYLSLVTRKLGQRTIIHQLILISLESSTRQLKEASLMRLCTMKGKAQREEIM